MAQLKNLFTLVIVIYNHPSGFIGKLIGPLYEEYPNIPDCCGYLIVGKNSSMGWAFKLHVKNGRISLMKSQWIYINQNGLNPVCLGQLMDRKSIRSIGEHCEWRKRMTQRIRIEFDIDDPGDKLAAIRAMKSTDAYLVIYSMREYLIKNDHHNILEQMNHFIWKYGIDLENELS
jgi:hypothetical protein